MRKLALIKGININNNNKTGTAHIMFVNIGSNVEYLNKIQEHPAGWWWYYLLSLNILVNCVRSLMGSIDFDPIIDATHSSFDRDTWAVTSPTNLSRDTFANDMDRFLNKLELNSNRDEPSVATKFEYLTNASNEVMSVLKENKDLETGGRCTILR